MSDTGGGSGTSPAPGMSDSEGIVGRTTSASGMSRTSGTSRTSLVASAPTTTISTIAVQSGNTRIVIALLQSAEWLELRVVELTPGMVYLGATLEEATQLLQAHEEVLAKLQSKQSPVEDLLNQADQLISTQRPRAEVYASMAESLGLAWKDLNAQLETRKQILDMGVAFHTRARQYSDSMDAAERVYTDNVLPSDAEGARQLLSQLHDHKRAILEASMYTLQEAQALLARLRGLATEGATLDSRPQHIKTNIEFACSQIEHYLESLHDRRRFLDGLFSARKHHLEQCLALCLLYQDLTEAVTSLKQLRDEVSEHQGLGESQGNAEILLHEHLRRETAAKEQQDKCIRLLKTAERMASGGHYAGLEARSRAYSVLEAATALHETCDTRTALLQQSILFFKLAQTAMTKLDQAEVQVASLGGEGAQRLSLVVGVVEEAIQPALAEGYAILEVTGGRNQPHNLGISLVVEELERRRSHLSSICVSSTEQVLQRTELSNAFLEQYNTIESWLVRIGDAFLQGHQDPGGSLSLARDFLHLHQTLNNDVMEKKREIDSLDTFLSKLLPDLSEEEAAGYQEKMQALKDHWDALKKVLDIRIAISDKYVKFHEDAEAVNNEHESLERLLKEAHGDDVVPQVEAKWEQVQKLYLELCNNGKAFCQDVKNVEDPFLDTNRAVLCVENILEQLGKRRLVITDLHSHFHMKITTTKEMLLLWNTYRENVIKMQSEMSSLETDFCPLLRGDPADPEDIASTLEQRLSVYVSAVKKTQEDIQNMMTRAEVMSYKGDQGGQRDEVIGALLQLYQNLQNKATEYQILGHMLIQWCRNIAEIHRSCDKLESQFGNVSLDIGGIEGQLLEHEASKQAVLELLKFAQNESTSIVTKIKEQCPPDAGAQDIGMINEMLERRGRVFETVWSHHQQMLERQLKRSQYHVDLQVISDQLRDLSEQLGRMRGHYGDSLGAAKNMQTAFTQFKITVDMLERRIQTFVSTAVKMLGQEDDSGEVQQELAELEKKWSTFQRQVGESEKSIELSIDFFKLVEEAEDWFKNGSKLLVTVAGESSNIQNPDQAQKLRKRIEHFLQPGEQAQAQRITKISSLALQLYGSATPRQIEVVSHQNTHMLESFNVINRNLEMLIINLKNAEDLREKQKKEKEELAASLTAAQAEAEAARLRAAAAEEARRAAEEVARTMAIPVEPIVPERVEIEIQTEAIPLSPEEPQKPEETPPAKKAKLIDDEPQHMPPVFMTPLVGASVSEGVKFSFECRVIGFPMPEVEWLKDNMSISGNPDYKTSFEEGVCTLTIEETFTEDSALFTCKAVNAAGMAETSATLTVKEAEAVEVMAPPLFTKRLVDTAAEEGSSYQLEATVEGHPLPVVSWSKDGKCVDESPDYVITFNNGECMLRFEEVFVEDQAEYQCKATNDLGEDITKARLTVTAVELSERPKFTMLLSNVMARAGQKFKLECQVTGNPTPTITWFHNNKPVKETPDCRLTFDGQTATLVMSEAFPKNAGTYTVVAKNSAGEAQCSANVSVKGRIPTETSDSEVASDIDAEPVKPSVQLPLKDTSIQEGRPARLDCVIVGQPEPEVIWYHDDKPVKESNDFKLLFHGDRCSLIIQEAFLEDAGIYRVVAMNSAGEASTACFLNVEPVPELAPPSEPEAPTVAPRFSQLLTDSHVTEGKPITLRASVTGEPAPTIAWFKDGVPLLPDNEFQIQENPDGSLIVHINAATLDHTGQYEIVASNAAGTAKCVAYLSIEPRLPTPPLPEHREPPVFSKLIQDVTVTSGSGVIFEADVTGVPKPTVYWTLNDCHLTGQEYLHGQLQYLIGNRGSVHSLELPTTSKLQAGIITIVAENAAGKAVSAATLKILDPPTAVAKPAAMEPQGKPQHHVKEESYTSSTTSSSTMFQQSSMVETSHITKVIMTSGGMDEKKHSMSAASTSQVKKVSGQPATEVHKAHFQEMRQDGTAPAVVSDKVSMVKVEGDKVVQQVSQDTGTVFVTPPPKKFATGKRKAAPARFITPLQSIIAKEDDRIVLESTIDGYPEPSVTWTHNDGPLKDDIQVKTQLNKTSLTIPRVNQGHSGHYTCFIQNEGGSSQCTCDVIIKKKQFPPVISKRLQPVVVGANERLHMEIDVTGTPLPEVSWMKDGQPLTPSDRLTQRSEGTRHLLIIQEAQLDDSGRYGAIATNPAGRAETLADVMVTQLIMDEKPQTHKIVFTDVTDETKMFTSRSEEVREERRGGAQGTKPTPETKPAKEEKKPKYEEFRRETHGHLGTSGPYSEDTYYAMKDESDISTDGGRTKKKVEMKSETHVEVMSDKKVEVFESTSVDVSPKPKKKQVVKMEQKHEVKAIQDSRPTETSAPVPASEPKVKSTPPAEAKISEKEIKVSSVSERKEHLVKQSFTSEKQVLPQPVKKVSLKTEPEKDVKTPIKVPKIEPLKSTGLVKQAVTIQEKEKIELDLKPFPFEPEPEKPKKPRGPPPSHPSKFKKGEFHESDYDSDYEGKIAPKWKPADSDAEENVYGKVQPPLGKGKVSQPHVRTPTPPSAFDQPPQFEGPARPKIDFPESETEPERDVSPEIVIPEKVEYVAPPEPPKVAPKEPKIFRSQPPKKELPKKEPPKKEPPPRSPSPVLQPGTPPEELYAESKPKESPFSNAIGVESTKITKIADSSAYHKRFVTMQQTTRVIKFTDSRTATTSTESQQTSSSERKSRSTKREEPKREPLPALEPFPFTPDPPKPKKDRGVPPPKPKKFHKGDFTGSDYESDYEGRIRPKWQPPDSDAEDPNYTKVKPQLRSDRTPSKTRERTPTPPTVFDVPPEEGPWRPSVERVEITVESAPSAEIPIPKEVLKKEMQKKVVVKATKSIEKLPERPVSPELPPPGTPPEEGVIIQQTEYVVDKVDVKSRILPPPMQEVQTYEEKPYTKIIERTEKTFTDIKLEEEMRMRKEKMERKTTTETDYEQVPERPPPPVEEEHVVVESERVMDLEPFPFTVEEPKPKKERGPPPPKPKKFYKGEFRESDYESDYEGRLKPKWKPADSDVEDPEYTPVRPPPPRERTVSKSRDRTPTPPSKFDVPPTSGEPLRPVIKPIDQPLVQAFKETSPEIIIPKIEEKVSKTPKVVPKAPSIKVKQEEPERPKVPSPPLPEPGPQPEIGYVEGGTATIVQEEEDAHIRMIKKKIEAKKGFQIDIDITDIYDFVSESELEKTDTESGKGKQFPKLEPFPYEPEPHRPKRERGPPPPQPKKFFKGEFRGSDYESDYDSRPIAPKWLPPDSEGEEPMYRRVAPPAGDPGKRRSESSGRDPSPPSKFDQPPQFEGPPRPVVELSDIPRRERRESLEEYSIPRFPKVEFKPFDLEDENRHHPHISHTDTETEPEALTQPLSPTKTGIDKKYAKSAQKVVSHQFEDMTQTFRHKAQKFAEQLVTEVFAAREGSVPAEPAGEPPSMPEELKKQSVSPVSTAAPPTTADGLATDVQEPQAYRDESRVSEFAPGSPLSATPPSTPSTPRSGPLTQPKRPPHYITPLRDLAVLVGETLRLECVVQADPPVQVTWSKGGSVLQNGPDYQIVYRNGVCRLIIPQVLPEDEGVYTCTAVNLLGVDSTSATVCITVQQGVQRIQGPTQMMPVGLPAGASPPVFEQIFRNARFAQGGDAMFEGKVQGNPKPTVTWTRKGAQIVSGNKYQVTHDENTGVVTLNITAIGPGDEGEYTCTAANQYGEAICTVYIQPEAAYMMQQQRQSMQMQQSKSMMQQQQMSQTFSQQQQQMMSVQNGHMESFRVDTFEYRLLHEVEFRRSLTITVAGELEVDLGAIQGPPQAPQLQQKPRSTKVSDGGNATFTVNVNGYPTPRVIWFKNGVGLQQSDKYLMTQSAGQVTLVVKQVNSQDSGYYTMLAENSSGCTVASAQLAVVPRGEVTNGAPSPEVIRPERIEQQQAQQQMEVDTGEESGKSLEPKFVRGPADREVQEGKMVRFDARCSGRPYPEVTWYINGQLVVDDATHKVLVNEAGNHSLMISKASLSDAGVITCVAKNKSGEANFQCQLNVLEMQQMVAPKFVERFQQGAVAEGETVVLQCRAVGTPMPFLTWQKDGVSVENNPNVMVQSDQNGASTLQILSASASDAGWYQCNAQNSAGSAATRARLHVQSTKPSGPAQPQRPHFPRPVKFIEPEPEPEPEVIMLRPVERAHHVPKAPEEEQPVEPPKFTHPLRDIDIVEGTRAHFEAKVTPVGDATMNIEWLIDGKPLAASSRATVTYRFGFVALDILNVIKADAGVYTCRATNAKGQAETSANLRITERPLIESQTQHPEALQQISYLEDQSRYQRTVSIEESSTIKPSFVKPLANLGEVMEGKYAHFEAQLHPVSDPFMRIEWFKDGKPITASSRINVIYNFGYVALNIMHLRPEDSGTYTVRATNKAGECQCQASIQVITLSSVTGDLGIPEQAQHIRSVEEMEAYRLQMQQRTAQEIAEATTAPVFKTELKDATAREGGYAHFEARLEPIGDPNLKVEWLKDGRPIEASSRITSFFNFGYVALTVKALIIQDAGTYTCVAKNSKGEAQVTAQLTVLSKTDTEVETQYQETVAKMQYLEDSTRYQKTETEETSAVTIPPKFLGPLKGTNKIVEGQKAHFEIRLEPQSDPTMTVEWYFNGQVIMSASRIKTYHDFGYVSLDISDVRQSDAGQYTVLARNALGQAQMSSIMTVETRSAIDTTSMHEVTLSKTSAMERRHQEPQYDIEEISRSKPEFTQLLSDPKPLPEGKNVHLEARLEPMNDPTMKVEWFFNGKPITIGSRFKTYFDFGFVALDIIGAYTTDSGEYTCRAENMLGSAHTSSCVRVIGTSDVLSESMHDNAMEQIHYLEDASRHQRSMHEQTEINEAPTFVKSLKNIETIEGTNIHLEARLKPVGDSSMRIDWFFNDEPLKVGHRFRPAYDFDYVALDLLSVYPIDSGIYTCRATNKLGQAVTSASVKVTAKKDLVFDSEHPDSLQKLQYLDDSSRYQRRETMEEVSVKIKPRFLTQLKSVTLKEGMNAHFEAKIEPITDPNLRIDWYRNGMPIQLGSRFRLIHDFGYVALDISRVIEEDSGTYTCVATNLMGKDEITADLKVLNSASIVMESQNQTMTMEQLQMLEDRSKYSRTEQVEETTKQAPVFTTSLKNIEILEGQRAHFELKLIPTSDPTMKVEWFHNNVPVKSGSRFTEYNDFGFVALDIMYCYAEDSGTYTCVATNCMGQAMSTGNLVCHTKETILSDTMNQEAMSKISRLESSRTQRTITTEEITMQAPVFTAPLRDQQLIENAPLHFEARLIPVGDPDLKVEWFKNNVPIQQANRISTMHDFGYVALDMKYVNPEDSGTYTCRATNRLGQAVTTASLVVTSKEALLLETQHSEALEKLRYLEDSSRYTKSTTEETVITQAPKFVVKLSGLTKLWEGQSAHVECRLEPYPDPSMKVEWFHNGQALQVGHRFRTMYDFGFCAMDILQAVAEDSGTYEVRATNRIGTATSSITIEVKPKSDFIVETQHPEAMAKITRLEQKAPHRLPEDSVVIEKPNFGRPLRNQDHLIEGQSIHMEATLTPVNDPTMKVEWFFNGQPIPQGHRFRTTYDFGFVALDILYAYPEDCGTYMCKATNAAGQAVTSCSIKVEGKLEMARRVHGCFVYTGDAPAFRPPRHTPYN